MRKLPIFVVAALAAGTAHAQFHSFQQPHGFGQAPAVSPAIPPTHIDPITPMPPQVTYTRIGSAVYGTDGSSATRIGDTTFYSDGVTAHDIGDATFYSNGVTEQRIGNRGQLSDGSSYTRIGDAYYFDNGTICTMIGQQFTCDAR